MAVGRLRELIKQGKEIALQEIRAENAERWMDFDDRALIWQILVPAWTLPLAFECDFPTGGTGGIEQLFRRMEAAGACHANPVSNSLNGETSWLNYTTPTQTRDEIFQTVRRANKYDQSFFKKEAGIIARRILQARSFLDDSKAHKIYNGVLPENILNWAQIADRAQNIDEFGKWFDNLAKELSEQNNSGELSRWIDTARSLEELFGSEFSFVIARAVRQLELFHRRTEDRRRLSKFLERAEQIAAFDRLLTGDTHWALHYIGAGGSGKTMLIRHITANLSEAYGRCVARVDFDYLNPDYPARAPGLLLAYLADEFRVYAPNQHTVELLSQVNRKIAKLHDVLKVSGENVSPEESLEPIFIEILPLFADALRLLPPPLIILDTCEELLKVRVDGSVPPSLAATFMILERMRDPNQPETYVSELRVVFGGRRPIAKAGADWRIENVTLDEKPYLDIHIIRGFTRAEARQYLEEKEKLNELRPAAVEPIIENSVEQIIIKNISFDSPEAFSSEPRYNPFDLWLYASWLHEDKTLSLETLRRADSDRYVELRIVQRQTNAKLRDLLPFIALLGRFSETKLREISGFGDETEFKKLFTEIGNLEWVGWQANQILEVDRALQPRLLAYFENRRTENFRQAQRKTLDYLENFTLRAKRDELDIIYFVVAYRLLRSDPERALRWWENVEQRFATEQAASILKQICESIIGAETAEMPLAEKIRMLDAADARLLATVHISYAGTLRQTRAFGAIEQVLAGAILLLENRAEADSKNLLSRAAAGQLAVTAQLNPQAVTDEQIERLWRDLTEVESINFQTAGALVAAAEAVIELLEKRQHAFIPAYAGLENLAAVLARTPGCKNLAFFTEALSVRLLSLAGKQVEVAQQLRALLLDEAVIAYSSPVVIPPQTFLDWLAPSMLDARIKTEFVRLAYPIYGAAEILKIVGDKIPAPNSVDADRLGSAILQLRSAIGIPELMDVEEFVSEIKYSATHEATVNVHRTFPPLFAAYAEALAARGRVDEAVQLLKERASASESSSFSELEATQDADRALLRIARRMRLRDEKIAIETSIDPRAKLSDAELVWTTRATSNPERETDFNFEDYFVLPLPEDSLPALLHARYRSFYSFYPDAKSQIADRLGETAAHPNKINSFDLLMCFLDNVEIRLIHERLNLKISSPQSALKDAKKTKVWRETLETDSIEKFVLLVRQAALESKQINDGNLENGNLLDKIERWLQSKENSIENKLLIDDAADENLLDKIGYRRAALIALDEGELLALRLPENAVLLLNFAHKLFKRADDNVGALIAQIAVSIATARSGDILTLDKTLSKIENEFNRRFVETIQSLPSWSKISKAAQNPELQTLETLSPHGWRPWIIRLVSCLIWQKDGYRAEKRTGRLRHWLETNYGTDSVTGKILPAEFEGWLTETTALESDNRTGPDNLSKNKTIESGSAPKAAETKLVIRVDGQKITKQAVPRTMMLTIKDHMLSRDAAWVFDNPFAGGIQLSLPTLEPYRTAIRETNLSRMIGEYNFIFEKNCQLEIEYPAAVICWESLVGFALADRSEIGDLEIVSPQIRRKISGTRTRFLPAREAEETSQQLAVTWTNDSYAAELSHLNWRELSTGLDYEHRISVSGSSRSFSEFLAEYKGNTDLRILHIVAAPVETSAGVRLKMSGDTFFESSSSLESSDAVSYTSNTREELIRIENLCFEFPQLAVALIQAPLREALNSRTRADREQAAYLRLLGAEMSRFGVPLVVTIPALPAKLFGEVLRRINRGLRVAQKTGDFQSNEVTSSLLEAIVEARQFIVESKAADIEDLLETAFDICLYAADFES